MSRILKFRAWSGEQMIEWDKLKNLRYSIENENIAVMQFTGLSDSKGNEIYEGDLISCGQNDYNPTEVYFDNDLASYSVSTYHATLQLHDVIDSKAEVIGNIYENPELLKSQL